MHGKASLTESLARRKGRGQTRFSRSKPRADLTSDWEKGREGEGSKQSLAGGRTSPVFSCSKPAAAAATMAGWSKGMREGGAYAVD